MNFFTGDSGHESVFLLAVKEQPIAEAIHNKIYGVCFVDTRVGNFYVSIMLFPMVVILCSYSAARAV